MQSNEASTREPVNAQEAVAMLSWRKAAGDHLDSEFWAYFDRLSPSAKADRDVIEQYAKEHKPALQSARGLDGAMQNAQEKFFSAGGSLAEWEQARPGIRSELLRNAALAHGDSREEAVRHFEQKGFRVITPQDF